MGQATYHCWCQDARMLFPVAVGPRVIEFLLSLVAKDNWGSIG